MSAVLLPSPPTSLGMASYLWKRHLGGTRKISSACETLTRCASFDWIGVVADTVLRQTSEQRMGRADLVRGASFRLSWTARRRPLLRLLRSLLHARSQRTALSCLEEPPCLDPLHRCQRNRLYESQRRRADVRTCAWSGTTISRQVPRWFNGAAGSPDTTAVPLATAPGLRVCGLAHQDGTTETAVLRHARRRPSCSRG